MPGGGDGPRIVCAIGGPVGENMFWPVVGPDIGCAVGGPAVENMFWVGVAMSNI